MKNTKTHGTFGKILLLPLLFMLQSGLSQVTKVSITNGNWSNASTWSPNGVPQAGSKVKIYHNVTLNVTINPTDTIFVYGRLNIASSCTMNLANGDLVLASNPTYTGSLGTIGSGGNINGQYIVQRYMQRCDGYSNYGMPFDVSTSSLDWYYCNNCMPGWSNIYMYDETATGSLDNGWYDTINGVLKRGKGFFYWFQNYTGGANFPRTISMQGSTNLQSAFNFSVTRTGGNSSNNGHNLIANPFAGTLDWFASNGWTKSGVNNAIYTWNNCNATYASYVGGVGVNGGNRYIAPLQGFWVQTSSSTPILQVTSAALSTASVALLRQSKDTISNVLRISLGDDEAAIRLDANSSIFQDEQTDAIFYIADNSRLYSTNGTKDSVQYAINSISDKGGKIFLSARNSGTLNFSGLPTFNGDYDIVLTDLRSGTQSNITEGMQYVYTDTNKVTFLKTFEISFTKRERVTTGLSAPRLSSARVYADHENIRVSLPEGTSFPVQVKMTDLLGREIWSSTEEQFLFSVPKPDQPVIVTVSNDESSLSKKVF